MKLHLMSGPLRLPGYTNLDAVHPADIQVTVPPLPFSMRDLEEILWVHGPGQLYPWELPPLLADCYAALAPGGRLAIETPDRRRALESGRPEWIHGDPSLSEPLHMVRWSYTPDELLALVRAAGFGRCELMAAEYHVPARDFRIVATK